MSDNNPSFIFPADTINILQSYKAQALISYYLNMAEEEKNQNNIKNKKPSSQGTASLYTESILDFLGSMLLLQNWNKTNDWVFFM